MRWARDSVLSFQENLAHTLALSWAREEEGEFQKWNMPRACHVALVLSLSFLVAGTVNRGLLLPLGFGGGEEGN